MSEDLSQIYMVKRDLRTGSLKSIQTLENKLFSVIVWLLSYIYLIDPYTIH